MLEDIYLTEDAVAQAEKALADFLGDGGKLSHLGDPEFALAQCNMERRAEGEPAIGAREWALAWSSRQILECQLPLFGGDL